MNDRQLTCIACGRTSDEVPVITFEYKTKRYGICIQHLPVMIHKLDTLADKLPGVENLPAAEGHEH